MKIELAREIHRLMDQINMWANAILNAQPEAIAEILKAVTDEKEVYPDLNRMSLDAMFLHESLSDLMEILKSFPKNA
jgi:hypothetical protein